MFGLDLSRGRDTGGFAASTAILTSGGAYRRDVQSFNDAAGRARDYAWASYNLFVTVHIGVTGCVFHDGRMWHDDSGFIDQSRAHFLSVPSYIQRYGCYPSVRVVYWVRS